VHATPLDTTESSLLIKNFVETPSELFRLSSPLQVGQVSGDIAAVSKKIIERSEKVHQLRLKRIELLSLPAHSVSGRNKELASLAVGAVSGALSLSFHPAFALIFFVSYRMYKRANRPTEERLRSPEKAKDINEEIRGLVQENERDLAHLRRQLIR
jgi:hypothetical protein